MCKYEIKTTFKITLFAPLLFIEKDDSYEITCYENSHFQLIAIFTYIFPGTNCHKPFSCGVQKLFFKQ